MNQESALESVVDSAFYFPAGSTLPTAQDEPALPEWQQLSGEGSANSSARRHVAEMNKELLHQLCRHTLHRVHSDAFTNVTDALRRFPLSDDIPSVLLHTGVNMSDQNVIMDHLAKHIESNTNQAVVRLKAEECADLHFTSRLLASRLWGAISARPASDVSAPTPTATTAIPAGQEHKSDAIALFLHQLQGVSASQLHGGGHLPGSTLLGSLAEWAAANAAAADGTVGPQCVLFLEGADKLSAGVLSGVLRSLREHRGLTGGVASHTHCLPVSVVFSISAPAEVFHSRLHRTAAQCVRITNVHLLNPLVTLDVLLHSALVRGVLPVTPPPRAVKWALSHALAWNLSLTSMAQRFMAFGVLAAHSSPVFSLSGAMPQPLFTPVHCALTQQLLAACTQRTGTAAGRGDSILQALEGTHSEHANEADVTALQALFTSGKQGGASAASHTTLPIETTSCLWYTAAQRAASVPAYVFQTVLDSPAWQAFRASRGSEWEHDGVPHAEIAACQALNTLADSWLGDGRAEDALAAAQAALRTQAHVPKRKGKGPRNTAPQAERGIRRVIGDFMLAPDAPALSVVQTPALWPAGFALGVDSTEAVLTPATKWLALPSSAACASALGAAGASPASAPEASPATSMRRGTRRKAAAKRPSARSARTSDADDSDDSSDGSSDGTSASLDEMGEKQLQLTRDLAASNALAAVTEHSSTLAQTAPAGHNAAGAPEQRNPPCMPVVRGEGAPRWWLRGDRRRLALALYRLAVARLARHRVFRVLAYISALRERGVGNVQGDGEEHWAGAFPVPSATCTSERRMFVEVTTSATPVIASAWFTNLRDALRTLPWEGLAAFVGSLLTVLLRGTTQNSAETAKGFLFSGSLSPVDAACPWPAAFGAEIEAAVRLRAELRGLRQAGTTSTEESASSTPAAQGAGKPAMRFASSARRRAAALKSAASAAATPLSRARDAVWGWVTAAVQRWCVPTSELPLGALFFGTSETQLKRALAPQLRESTLEALESPDMYLIDIAPPGDSSAGGGSAAASVAASSLVRVDPLAPDAARAYAIYKRAAKRISLAEWLSAFLASFEEDAAPGGAGLDVGAIVAGAAKGRRVAGQRRGGAGGDASDRKKPGAPRRRGVKRSRVGARSEHEVTPGTPPKRSRGEHPPLTSPDPTAGSDEDSHSDEGSAAGGDGHGACGQLDVEGAKCRFIAAVRQLGMLGLLRKAGAGRDDAIQKLVFDTVAW